MLRLHEEKTLPYTPKQLFDLVLDIESYPSFLPFCVSSKRISGSLDEGEITAEVGIKFGFMEKKYASLIKPHFKDECARIDIMAITGPFKHLHSHWEFKPINNSHPEFDSGSGMTYEIPDQVRDDQYVRRDDHCYTKVSFSLDFEFESSLLNKMMSGYLKEAYAKMMNAFEKRARSVYEQKDNTA